MALLDSLTSALVGGPQNVSGFGAAQQFKLPQLLQFLALGGQPQQITKKEFKHLSPTERIRFGKGMYRLPTTQDLEQAGLARQQREIQLEKQAFENLKDSPFFDSLVGDAVPGAVNEQFGGVLNQLAQRSLGAAAGAGLNLADPLVQAKALGPLALQGLLAQKNLQRQAGLTGLGLVQGPAASSAPGAAHSMFGGILPQGSQQAFFNTQTQQQHQGIGLGLLSGGMQAGGMTLGMLSQY